MHKIDTFILQSRNKTILLFFVAGRPFPVVGGTYVDGAFCKAFLNAAKLSSRTPRKTLYTAACFGGWGLRPPSVLVAQGVSALCQLLVGNRYLENCFSLAGKRFGLTKDAINQLPLMAW